MNSRKTSRIGNIGKVVTGKTPSTAMPDYFGADYPFLTPTDMRGNKWARATERGLSTAGAATLRSRIPAGSVAVSCIGWQMGKAVLTDRPTYTNQQINTIIPNSGFDAEYLYYYFATRREELLSIGAAGGVRTPIINKSSFEAMEVELPALRCQRSIASILCAYDDLIENNTRRIAILEEMARRLYEEWFVRFRFPGHEGLATTEGLPAGWSLTTLGSITTKIGSGATPRGGKSAYFDSGVTLIRSQNIFDYNFVDKGLAFLDDEQAAQLQGVAVESNDVLLNITGASVARCCMVPLRHLPARVNQHVMLIRADSARMEPSYLLCAINSVEMKRQLLAYAQTGSTREALTREMMSQFAVLLPDQATLRKFGKIAGDIFRQREILADKNANLRTTRDFLLPKLISGELDVSTLPNHRPKPHELW